MPSKNYIIINRLSAVTSENPIFTVVGRNFLYLVISVIVMYDAVIIPGGGLTRSGEVPGYVRLRLDRALGEEAGYLIPLSFGTTHISPPLDAEGFPIAEFIAAADYLKRNGVGADSILPEAVSLDTIGNAYFCRVIHTEPLGLRKLLVVTNKLHMPRTREIFDWLFGMQASYDIDYLAVENGGIAEDVLRERIAKESNGRDNVLRLKQRIHSLKEFHRWLYSEHAAYASGKKPERASGKVLESY